MTESWSERSTIVHAGALEQRSHLFAVGPNECVRYELPLDGELVVGRAAECDVAINDPSLSRRHAVIRTGTSITVEDLGSANGTIVGDRRIDPNTRVEVGPGEVIDFGVWMIVIHRRVETSRQRRLWTHGAFEAKLESECARAIRIGSGVAVIRLAVGRGASPGAVRRVLEPLLDPDEIVAAYGPGEYEVLLARDVETRTPRLVALVADEIEKLGVLARVGAARLPIDGRTPEALMAKACAGVRGELELGGGPRAPVVVDPVMHKVYRLIERIAPSSISVLILGETGTGKEVIAEAIHARSSRSSGPFLRLNCAALTETLLESELFGYEKGAFTGADRAKPGLLETANGGTVLLDEVGELPESTQAKLLRVLEERAVRRLGGLEAKKIDVRVLAATNRDLEKDAEHGGFRRDLYYRLGGITVTLPPLRERPSEIDALAAMFVRDACKREMREVEPKLSPRARALLADYAWPGNIRELRNVIERAVLLCSGEVIDEEHLPIEKLARVDRVAAAVSAKPAVDEVPLETEDLAEDAQDEAPLGEELRLLERNRIIAALDRCAGNQTQAARMLGISRRTLVKRLDRHRLPRPRKQT